jgi:hypothetical protein
MVVVVVVVVCCGLGGAGDASAMATSRGSSVAVAVAVAVAVTDWLAVPVSLLERPFTTVIESTDPSDRSRFRVMRGEHDEHDP